MSRPTKIGIWRAARELTKRSLLRSLAPQEDREACRAITRWHSCRLSDVKQYSVSSGPEHVRMYDMCGAIAL